MEQDRNALIVEYAALATKTGSLLGTTVSTRMSEIEEQLNMQPIDIMAEATRIAVSTFK